MLIRRWHPPAFPDCWRDHRYLWVPVDPPLGAGATVSLIGETQVRRWLTSVRLRPQPDGVYLTELLAFTDLGVEMVASSWSLAELARIPPDRLALGPVTHGGAVATHSAAGVRAVCVDLDGTPSVWWAPHQCRSGQPRVKANLAVVSDDPVDQVALRLLRRLLNPEVTRPTARELAARLLLWAVLDRVPLAAATPTGGFAPDPLDSLSWHDVPPAPGPGPPTPPARLPQVRPGTWAGEADPLAAAVGALATRRVGVLAELVAVRLDSEPTPHDLRRLARAVDHPDPDWAGLVDPGDTPSLLDVLHAFIPTRWMLAGELRSHFNRADLAAMVLSAPSL